MFLASNGIDWAGIKEMLDGYADGGIFGFFGSAFSVLIENIRTGLKDLLIVLDRILVFLQDTFAELLYITEILGSFLGNIPSYFGWLPTSCVVLVVTVFGVVAVYMVAGRK